MSFSIRHLGDKASECQRGAFVAQEDPCGSRRDPGAQILEVSARDGFPSPRPGVHSTTLAARLRGMASEEGACFRVWHQDKVNHAQVTVVQPFHGIYFRTDDPRHSRASRRGSSHEGHAELGSEIGSCERAHVVALCREGLVCRGHRGCLGLSKEYCGEGLWRVVGCRHCDLPLVGSRGVLLALGTHRGPFRSREVNLFAP
mmetsp:Transcript_69361/g.225178  ORF Transcript_69361/g.225178 Transcript_69361/m.225178 type:complete len:201 (-) Transcript_69361:217-819(-)